MQFTLSFTPAIGGAQHPAHVSLLRCRNECLVETQLGLVKEQYSI